MKLKKALVALLSAALVVVGSIGTTLPAHAAEEDWVPQSSLTLTAPCAPEGEIVQVEGIWDQADEELASGPWIRDESGDVREPGDSPFPRLPAGTYTYWIVVLNLQTGQEVQSADFALVIETCANDLTIVTPDAPSQAGNVVTVPNVEGVEYQDEDGKVLEPGDITLNEDLIIVGVPKDGYEFEDGTEDEWTFTYTPEEEPSTIMVTPTEPTQDGNVVTVPNVEGVDYQDEDGNVLEPGDITLNEDLIIVGVPAEGYGFPEGVETTWVFVFTPDIVVPVTPGALNYPDGVCFDAPFTITGSEWNPADVLTISVLPFVFDVQPNETGPTPYYEGTVTISAEGTFTHDATIPAAAVGNDLGGGPGTLGIYLTVQSGDSDASPAGRHALNIRNCVTDGTDTEPPGSGGTDADGSGGDSDAGNPTGSDADLLAATGAEDATPLLAAGIILLLVGAVVLAARRRMLAMRE